MCKEANVELDRFESEIDSYLKASSTAEATPPSPEAATPPIKTDRDQISLESGYMSSYPVDAQRSSAILWFWYKLISIYPCVSFYVSENSFSFYFNLNPSSLLPLPLPFQKKSKKIIIAQIISWLFSSV